MVNIIKLTNRDLNINKSNFHDDLLEDSLEDIDLTIDNNNKNHNKIKEDITDQITNIQEKSKVYNSDVSPGFISSNKLLAQVELNKNLINERNQEIEQINKNVLMINEIFKDLNNLVDSQACPIVNIEKNMEKSVEYCEKQLEILKQIEQNQKSSQLKQKFLLLGTLGLIANAPVTLLLGLKVGLLSSIGTIGLSAVTTYFIKK